jgi:hypothetical protein
MITEPNGQSGRAHKKKKRQDNNGRDLMKEGRCMLLLLAIAAASSNDCGFDSYVGGKLSKERLISDYIKKAR